MNVYDHWEAGVIVFGFLFAVVFLFCLATDRKKELGYARKP